MKEGEKSENLSILRLFCSELKVQIASMESYLSRLNVVGDLSEAINALTKITHSIIGAAKIIRFEAIASLTKTLNRFFLSLPKESNKPLPTKYVSLLGQIIDYLKSVAELDEMALTIKMEHPDEQLERFETELALYTQAPSEVLIQTETPSRPVADEDISADPGMVNLFRIELENQTRILNNGLVSLEHGEKVKEQLDALMRAAHSIKGAARVVRLEPFIKLANLLEEYFVAAQKNELIVNEKDMDVLLGIVDFFPNSQAFQTPHYLLGWHKKGKVSKVLPKKFLLYLRVIQLQRKRWVRQNSLLILLQYSLKWSLKKHLQFSKSLTTVSLESQPTALID